MTGQPQEFVTSAEVARHLGVTRSAVANWIKRGAPGMPEPAGVLVAEGGRRVPIWTRGQLDILRAWHTARVMAELSARVPHGEATERFGWTRLPVENRAAEFRPGQAGF